MSSASSSPVGSRDTFSSRTVTLAVIKPSHATGLGSGLASVAGASGLLIAITGRLSAAQARELAAARPGGGLAIALLLAVSSWAARQGGNSGGTARGSSPAGGSSGAEGGGAADETAEAAGILATAGWRVATMTATTPLALAWQAVTDPNSAGTPLSRTGLPAPAAAARAERPTA